MKKFLSLLLALLLYCPFAAEEDATAILGDAYAAAALLMVQGDYAAAQKGFSALSAYSDAPQMAIYCRGLLLMSEGDYSQAARAFSQLGDFKDAPVQAALCRGYAARHFAEDAMKDRRLSSWQDAIDSLEAAAGLFDQFDFLPEAAIQAEECRALAMTITGWMHDNSFDILPGDARCGLCVVERDDLQGAVDLTGQLVIPCEWDYIDFISPGAVLVKRDGYYGVVSHDGETLVPCRAMSANIRYGNWSLRWTETDGTEEVSHFVEVDPNTGYVFPQDMNGSLLRNGLVAVQNATSSYSYGVLDPVTGEIIVPYEYSGITAFGDGVLAAKRIPPDFGSRSYTYESTCFSRTGEVLSIPENAEILYDSDLLGYSDGTQFYLMHADGRVLLEAEQIGGLTISNWSSNWRAFVTLENECIQLHLMDETCHLYPPIPVQDNIRSVIIYERRYIFCESWEATPFIVDLETGTQLLCEADTAYVGAGLFSVRDGEGYRLVDISGEPVTETVFTAIQSIAADSNSFRYDDPIDVPPENSHLIVVGQESGMGVINADMETVLPCEYKSITQYNEHFLLVKKENNKQGVYSLTGQEILPCEYYDWNISISGGLCKVEDDPMVYNARGEALLDTEAYPDWAMTDGCLFVLMDGLLTILDDQGVNLN